MVQITFSTDCRGKRRDFGREQLQTTLGEEHCQRVKPRRPYDNTLGSPSSLLSIPHLKPNQKSESKGTPTDAALTGQSLKEKAEMIWKDQGDSWHSRRGPAANGRL